MCETADGSTEERGSRNLNNSENGRDRHWGFFKVDRETTTIPMPKIWFWSNLSIRYGCVRVTVYCGFRLCAHDEQGEQEAITVSEKPTTVITAGGTKTNGRAGDRLRKGCGHVRGCPTSQRFSSRIINCKTLRRISVFV